MAATRTTRSIGAVVAVWLVSFASFPLHLTGLAAAVWIVATLVLVPIGATLTDRLVALLLLAAAPAVLIAWFSPQVPWLVSPPVLAGLLGTLVAVAWGLQWTRPVLTRVQDVVTLSLGALTAGLFWIPFAGGGYAGAIAVMSKGFDQSAHYFMWMRVWANHGYLLINTLPDPDFWDWRVYPQGSQAILADVGSVMTGAGSPLVAAEQSVTLFAVLLCLVVGVLAIVTAWSVDRLARSRRVVSAQRVVAFQVVAVLLVAVGPGSAVAVLSLSFTAGLAVTIPAVAIAATAGRSPRRDGLLVAASLIAAAAIYPICALLAVLVWPLYLWTSRRYWLASHRRRWLAVGWSAVAALLCSPMFFLLVFRGLDHGWDASGYFQIVNGIFYVGIAAILAWLMVFGRMRLPQAVQYAAWIAAAVMIVLNAEGVVQWITAGEPTYYTVKTMYLGWVLAVVVAGAGLASLRPRTVSAPTPSRRGAPSVVVAGLTAISALLVSIPMFALDQKDPNRGWQQALSKEGWVIARASSLRGYGSLAAQAGQYASKHAGITMVVPCLGSDEQTASRWAMFLNGGMDQTRWEVFRAACPATEQEPLGYLPGYLQSHPGITVNGLVAERQDYETLIGIKDQFGLTNLNLVPPVR
ncbi:MAG: hypothetical protein WCP28_08860 [Actinomycetes bacterium]